jgi:branched-chain amino acid transport system substrate-binding protein
MVSRAALVGIGVGVVVVVVVAVVVLTTYHPSGPRVYKIGSLSPLSGDLSADGKKADCAIKLAAALYSNQTHTNFTVTTLDTATSPSQALSQLQVMYSQGIHLIVGPMSSGELKQIMPFVTDNKIVTVSESSTSPYLGALGGPSILPQRKYVFRVVPTDAYQARALATLLSYMGVREVAIIYRKDPWGEGLNNALNQTLAAKGIRIDISVSYDTDKSKYTLQVPQLLSQIASALGSPSPSKAVVMVAFEEDGALIIQNAANNPTLSQVRWVGTDGVAYSDVLLSANPDFLNKVKFVGTVVAPPTGTSQYQQVAQLYKKYCGTDFSGYSPYAFDAAMLIMQAVTKAGTDDPDTVAQTIRSMNGTTVGVTGPIYFDAYGDRIEVNYVVYGVMGGKYVDAALYDGTKDQLTTINYPSLLSSS